MSTFVKVFFADGHRSEYPTRHFGVGHFEADQPLHVGETTITQVQLVRDDVAPIACFVLEAFSIQEQESGLWTIRISRDDEGAEIYDLEYYAKTQFGERVQPAVMQWNHEKNEMEGN
ncbi:MAG: hypothetical protein WCL32_13550 [Planctomycetota bacterium]